MKPNIGSTDKIVRMILAAIILALYFAEIVTGIFGIVLILVAITFILTSIVGFSPLYMILGITTRKKNN
jgi:hypothetical protein